MDMKAESLDYIHEARRMPWVFLGQRIEVDGRAGTIKGGMLGNLAVLFDGDKFLSNAHPTWKTKFFDSAGRVMAVDGQLVERSQ